MVFVLSEGQLVLRIEVPDEHIQQSLTRKFKSSATVREVVETCKRSVQSCFRDLSYNLYWDGLRLNEDEKLTALGLSDLDTVVMKPANQKEVSSVILAEMSYPSQLRVSDKDSSHIHKSYVKCGRLQLQKRKTTKKRFSDIYLAVTKKRWCVLKDNVIFYFNSAKDRVALGSIDLAHAKVQFQFDDDSVKYQSTFTVETEDACYVCVADTVAEAKSWEQAIMTRTSTDQSHRAKLLREALASGNVNMKINLFSQRKWVVLSGTNLYIYDSPADDEASNILNIFTNKITLNEEKKEFTVVTPTDNFVFSLESDGAMMTWKEALHSVMGDLAKPKTVEEEEYRSPENVIKEGYLFKKKSNRVFSSTKKRYCILTARRMYYFVNPTDDRPLGFWELQHTQVNLEPSSGSGSPILELITPGGIYDITCEDPAVLEDWCNTIKSQCVGSPFNVVHRQHMGEDLQWHIDSGKSDKIFDFLGIIGEGAYATVHRARHRESGWIMAIKVISIERTEMLEALHQEIDVLKKCRSENIVSYFGSKIEGKSLWVMTEYCACGSVKDLIQCSGFTFNEMQLSFVVTETLKGLLYLHGMNIIHHDIKAGNILLDEHCQVKLADFGVSRQFADMGDLKATDFIGSPFWMSPEVIGHGRYNHKTDIWSLGITIVEMAEGQPPNSHITSYAVLAKLSEQPPPTLSCPGEWSEHLNDFVKMCLIKDVDARPDAVIMLKHLFLQPLQNKTVIEDLVHSCLAVRRQTAKAQGGREKAKTILGMC